MPASRRQKSPAANTPPNAANPPANTKRKTAPAKTSAVHGNRISPNSTIRIYNLLARSLPQATLETQRDRLYVPMFWLEPQRALQLHHQMQNKPIRRVPVSKLPAMDHPTLRRVMESQKGRGAA